MSTGQKAGVSHLHGGHRAGSGRKATLFSVARIQALVNDEAAAEKEFGVSLNRILLNIAHGQILNGMEDSPSYQQRVACIKAIQEHTMLQIKAGSEEDEQVEAPVWLPELKPDPAKVVKMKKKDDK